MSQKTTYFIIEFTENKEVCVVPALWTETINDADICWWPSHIKSDSILRKAKLAPSVPDKNCWEKFNIKILGKNKLDTYEKASNRLIFYERNPNLSASEDESGKRIKKCPKEFEDDETSDDDHNNNSNIFDGEEFALPIPPRAIPFVGNSDQHPYTHVQLTPLTSKRQPLTFKQQTVKNNSQPPANNHSKVTNDSISQQPMTPLMTTTIKTNDQPTNKEIFEYLNKVNRNVLIVKEMLQELNRKVSVSSAILPTPPTENHFIKLLPINSSNNLEEMEDLLKDEGTNKEPLIQYLCQTGGNNSIEMVKRIMKTIMSDEVGETFSLSGKRGKRPFKELKIMDYITEAVIRIFKGSSRKEVETTVAEYLKHAKSRLQRRQVNSKT